MVGEMETKEKPKPSPDYLMQLMNDKKLMSSLPNFCGIFNHLERLLDEEISRVRKDMYNDTLNGSTEKRSAELPDAVGPIVQLQEKLYVPVKEYPDFNFVGRILGPRGLTAKQLEAETGCKIMVRGKGSMRDKKKEEQNRGKPNWEHLNEDLHVLITVEDAQNRAEIKLKRAVEEVKKLLIPAVSICMQAFDLRFQKAEGEDSLKKMQLMELAILNGTYRDANIKSPTAQAPRIITGPAPVLPPAALRTPTPAGPTIMPLIRQIQTAVMPNGTPHPTAAIVPPGPEAGLIYTPYEYPYTLAPATSILEYPIEPSVSSNIIQKENPWYPETIYLPECREESTGCCHLLPLITVSQTVHVEESFRRSQWGCSSAWERESPGAKAGKKFHGWLAATGESGCAADAVNLHLPGRGCALTLLCWMTPEQNPLQDLPAWPVATTAAPLWASLADPQGWEPWDALPTAECTTQFGLVPASLYRVSVRQRGHGTGISWKSSDGTRQIHRQTQITVNAGQHSHPSWGSLSLEQLSPDTKCSSQGWCNANLWQKTSYHHQHLLCPSSSHEKLIWVELWRDTGKWLLPGRGKREVFPYSVLLILKPSSFLFHLNSCDQDSFFPCTPGFLPSFPFPRQGGTLAPQPGAGPLEAESAPWIQGSTAGDPPCGGLPIYRFHDCLETDEQ
ncbi:hypothetical protein IHE44_0009173 [Lamprotornis superbus]|uniref:K Homology domain-containing protein n=5 Tax=Neoaves TaxID=3078114 RepID=A0A835TRZ3_9PASS|nr:hypothetical protein IHE44_0009173 [Lamprotornis superbus]